MAVITALKKSYPPKRKDDVSSYSINKCLYELGASAEDVYYAESIAPYYKWRRKRRYYSPYLGMGRRNESIYNIYSRDELLSWAEFLYKEKMKQYHPDRQKTSKIFFEEYCKYLGQVIDKVRNICSKGKKR